ncbi:MAG: hypothetical protein K0U12_03320 [Gammaproteobacteria bacterium]|nr:hypothetical protein [Gammaproteobacteria bacterium]
MPRYQLGLSLENNECRAVLIHTKPLRLLKYWQLAWQDDISLQQVLLDLRRQLPRRFTIIYGVENSLSNRHQVTLMKNFSDYELLSYCRQQSKVWFAQPLEKLYFDFKRHAINANQEVLDVVVARKDSLQTKLKQLKSHKLSVRHLIPQSAALLNFAKQSLPLADNVIGIIYLQTLSASLLVINKHMLHYYQQEKLLDHHLPKLPYYQLILNRLLQLYNSKPKQLALEKLIVIHDQRNIHATALQHTLPISFFSLDKLAGKLPDVLWPNLGCALWGVSCH